MDAIGYADAAGRRAFLQSRRHVDTVAVNVVAVDDHVALIDANSEGDPLFLGRIGIALGHPALNFDGGAHRLDDTRKFHQ